MGFSSAKNEMKLVALPWWTAVGGGRTWSKLLFEVVGGSYSVLVFGGKFGIGLVGAPMLVPFDHTKTTLIGTQ